MKLRNYLTLSGLVTLLMSSAETLAGIAPPPPVQAPALDEWGLLGLSLLVGAVGLVALFRRK
ncbi:MAG: IPTL-CTERM sorting domain-containing protein [Gammaproteobacteria bacterium]